MRCKDCVIENPDEKFCMWCITTKQFALTM